jgi:tetratricopeptide (TPR) repeat protein/transcriptional regulator with XRE-family HTH domain
MADSAHAEAPDEQHPARLLGQRLDTARRRRGWTYGQMEAHTGVPRSTLQYLVRRRRRAPDYHELRALVDRLGEHWDGEWERLWRCAVDADAVAATTAEDQEQQAGGPELDRPRVSGLPRPFQLPADTVHFTGRERELERLLGLATGARATPVAVVAGMAGIGKSALVTRAAHHMSGAFPEGVLFVDLHGFTPDAEATTPASALDTLLRGLGVPGEQIPPRLDAMTALYRSALAGGRVLVVLDNAFDESQVRPLLPGAPGCLVLVTSRRRLAGLDDAEHILLDTLEPAQASALFHSVVGARGEHPPAVVDRIVSLCAYLPLAIRIAGARLRVSRATTAAALCAQMEAEATPLATLHDGERSVDAVFSVSYRHLPDDQRRLFRLLSLVPGPDVDRHAAAALAGVEPELAAVRLDGLEAVSVVEQPSTGRYRFHDLLRSYAARRVVADEPEPERRAALARLLDHYTHTASMAMDLAHPHEAAQRPRVAPAATRGPDLRTAAAAVEWLDDEHANLMAAARHGSGRHAVPLSAILHRHLYIGGHYADAHDLHTRALEFARADGDRGAQPTALVGLGDIAFATTRDDDAAAHYGEALLITRDLGDRAGERAALLGLGRVHQATGRHQEAEDCLRRSLAIAREAGDRNGEHAALYPLGYVYRLVGRHEEARDCLERSLAIAREIGNRKGENGTLIGLGYVHLLTGEYDRAEECLREATAIAKDLGDRVGTLRALNVLGEVHRRTGHHERAAERLTEALALATDIGDRNGEVEALWNLGHVHHAMAAFDTATSHLEHALRLATDIGDRNGIFEALHGLGHAQQATGHANDALASHLAALEVARDLNQPHDQARAHDGIGHAHHALGDVESAHRHWRQARDIHAELGSPATGPPPG